MHRNNTEFKTIAAHAGVLPRQARQERVTKPQDRLRGRRTILLNCTLLKKCLTARFFFAEGVKTQRLGHKALPWRWLKNLEAKFVRRALEKDDGKSGAR